MSPNALLVLAIARGVRYRTLETAVGHRVHVATEASVVSDVASGLADVIPAGASERALRAGLPALVKYGLLDLEFELATPLALPRLSLRELRELGLLAPAPADEEQADPILEQVLEEVRSGKLWLKVMLDAVGDERAPMDRVKDVIAHRSSNQFLPREFRVRDACITNMPTLWLGKHFYL